MRRAGRPIEKAPRERSPALPFPPRRAACGAAAALLLLSLLVLLLGGCGEGDTTGPDTREEIVLFGYLYVNETVSEENAFLLARTRAVLEPYHLEDAVVSGALVTLRKEGEAEADTLAMARPGYYAGPGILIEARTTYHLTVEIEGEDPITASTTTPWPFDMLREPRAFPGTMTHAAIPDSFPIVFRCENEEQIFLVDAYCLEEWEDARYRDPFGTEEGPGSHDEYGGENGEPRHIAPYFRAKGLEREGDDYRIGWYGDLMVFYGAYDIHVLSIDENLYSWLYRDHPELYGGVSGGIGVFGSACRAGWRVEVVE
ncbi:MAG: hypothetical protein ABIH26_04370 [Candidatus Eisenbacteria bacterium]